MSDYDQLAAALRDIVAREGLNSAADAQRLDGLLRPAAPAAPALVEALVAVASHGVVPELAAAGTREPAEAVSARMTTWLQGQVVFDPALTEWAVATWAYALKAAGLVGVQAPAAPTPPPPVAATPPPPPAAPAPPSPYAATPAAAQTWQQPAGAPGPQPGPAVQDAARKRKMIIIIAAIVAVALVAILAVVLIVVLTGDDNVTPTPTPTPVVSTTAPTPTPTLSPSVSPSTSFDWVGTWVQVDDTKTGLVIEAAGTGTYDIHDPDGSNDFTGTLQSDGSVTGTVDLSDKQDGSLMATFTFTPMDSGNLSVHIEAGTETLDWELTKQ
jgi:hypothetical protein